MRTAVCALPIRHSNKSPLHSFHHVNAPLLPGRDCHIWISNNCFDLGLTDIPLLHSAFCMRVVGDSGHRATRIVVLRGPTGAFLPSLPLLALASTFTFYPLIGRLPHRTGN